MTMITVTQSEQPVSSGFRVDVLRGERVSRVSSEWFFRPDDERYLNLTDLYDAVRRRAARAQARTVESRAVRVEAARDNAGRLALLVPGRSEPVAPTHWSFGQLCGLVGAPTSYIRQLPAPLAGINLQHGLLSHRAELVKTLEADDGRIELRAVTGPDYGRIWDHELVAAVMKIAGNGVGVASFYLRAVCMNRNLWGVENFEQITIRHSKFAAQRFAHEATPALTSFANSSPAPFIAGIKSARERIVARNDEDRDDFLRKRGFSKSETTKIIETVLQEEGRPPESVFDFVQGITALARGKAHQDARLELEGKAKRLMERAI
jgi:hypothetical protein